MRYHGPALAQAPQHGERPHRDDVLERRIVSGGISFACMTAAAIWADVSGLDAVRKASCISRDSSLWAKYLVRR